MRHRLRQPDNMSEAMETTAAVAASNAGAVQPSYVSLHNHTVYSLLDGLSTPWQLAGQAKKLKMPAVAITDHGTCAGLYSFSKACHNVQLCEKCGAISDPDKDGCCSDVKCDGKLGAKGGIKPIFGIEAYFVDNAEVRDKDEVKRHLTIWAKNKIGYRNLIWLSSIAHTRYFYSKARLDFNAIKSHSEGLMIGTACAAGVICGPVLSGDPTLARKYVAQFQDHFRDDFYIEIMTHKFDDQECVNPNCKFKELKKTLTVCPLCNSPLMATTDRLKGAFKEAYAIALERGIKPIWTCDAHYINPEDWFAQDVLCSISTRNTIKNQKRFTFASKDFYLKSSEQAALRVPSHPDLLANTLEMAAKVEDEVMEPAKDTLPHFELPPGVKNEMDLLKSLVVTGMRAKGLNQFKEYRERALEEFRVIEKTGYSRYFLILHDVMSYARREKIRCGPGRGCFTPGNPVLTSDGLRPIEDIKVGEVVLGHDGRYHNVTDTHVYDINEEVVQIEVEDGRAITCTLDHKIFINRDGLQQWVEARQLVEGDDVVDYGLDQKEVGSGLSQNNSNEQERHTLHLRGVSNSISNTVEVSKGEAFEEGRSTLPKVLQGYLEGGGV